MKNLIANTLSFNESIDCPCFKLKTDKFHLYYLEIKISHLLSKVYMTINFIYSIFPDSADKLRRVR